MLKTDEYHALEQYQVGFGIIFKKYFGFDGYYVSSGI